MSTRRTLETYQKIAKILSNTLREENWKVIEEFPCLSTNGSNRRMDIIAYNEESRGGYIIDPTVRYKNDRLQPPADIQQRCKLKTMEVIGLFIGARGTISTLFKDFCAKFKIQNSIMEIE